MVPRELGLNEIWRIPIAEWEAVTGASCELREYELQSALMDTATLTREGALLVCPLNLIPQLHRDSALVPIPESGNLSGGWQSVFDGLRKSIGSPGGQPAVLPLSAPPLLCFYRGDLLEQAGLEPPATWDDYRRLASTIEDWAPGYSIVEPWGPEHRVTMFLQRSAGYALHPDNYSFTMAVANGEPLVNQPPFVRALQEVQADLAYLDPASLSMRPVDCYLQMRNGHAALAIGMLPQDASPPSREAMTDSGQDPPAQFRIQRLPGASEIFHTEDQAWSDVSTNAPNHVTVVGADAWVVCVVGNADSEIGHNAWHLWNAIDSPENRGGRSVSVFRSACRPNDFAERSGSPAERLDAELQRQFITATTASLRTSRVVAELPFPAHTRYRQLMSRRLSEVLEEGREPREALNDLVVDWRQLSEELGRESVLNSYRWCLGLTPLSLD